jgi:hypothetical protein
MSDGSNRACPPGVTGWNRRQGYTPVRGIANGQTQTFEFYDQGDCLSGWLLDLAAIRDVAGNLWECVITIRVRDGIRGDLWGRTWGDPTLGAPSVNGSLRLWVPFPRVTVAMTGIAAGAQTGTVQAQGIAMPRAEGRSVGGTKLAGFRTQTLPGGGGAVSYPLPPGATDYRVGGVGGATTAVRVSEISSGDDDLGSYTITPGNLIAPMPWAPAPPASDPASTANQSAIVLATAGGADDWTVSWLFDLET